MKARYTFCTKRTPSIWLPSCKRCGNCLLCSINKQVLWVVCFAFVFFIISLCTGGSYVQTGQWCVPMVVNWTIKIKRLWKWQKIKLVLMSSAVPLDLRVVDGIDNVISCHIIYFAIIFWRHCCTQQNWLPGVFWFMGDLNAMCQRTNDAQWGFTSLCRHY